MKDATLIADLVRAGLDAELVGRVVNEIVSGQRPESVRTNYLEFERERKRESRLVAKNADKSDEKQTMLAATETERRPDNAPDSVAASSLTSLLSSTSVDLLATKQGSKKEVVARRDRGTRIPDDWELSQALRELAIQLGVPAVEFQREFRDFWVAIPGARGRKCDWEATARNRLHEVAGRRKGNANGYGNNGFSAAAERLRARGAQFECQDNPGKPDELLERHDRG